MIDATVHPPNAAFMEAALAVMATMLQFGPNVLGHVQMPVLQSNATAKAVIKHGRAIEDSLMAKSVEVVQKVSLVFSNSPDSTRALPRRGAQHAIAAVADLENTKWAPPSVVDGIPLIRVSEMLGFADGEKPGPTARAEQTPGLAYIVRLHSSLQMRYLLCVRGSSAKACHEEGSSSSREDPPGVYDQCAMVRWRYACCCGPDSEPVPCRGLFSKRCNACKVKLVWLEL